MKHVRRLGVILVASMSAHFTVTPVATAETRNVSHMKFKNNGAYAGTPLVVYKIGENKKCFVFHNGKKTLHSGKSVTLKLGNNQKYVTEFGSHPDCRDGEIPDGVETWGALNVSTAGKLICRKSKTLKLKNYGGTVVYRFGGTTQNNNRCKVSKWP